MDERSVISKSGYDCPSLRPRRRPEAGGHARMPVPEVDRSFQTRVNFDTGCLRSFVLAALPLDEKCALSDAGASLEDADMIKKIALTLSTAALAAPMAIAGGFTAPVVDVEPVVLIPEVAVGSWQGGYIGANVNWGKAKVKAAGDLADALSSYGLSRTLAEPDGVAGAVRAGYDWQSGNFVYGVGGEYNFGKYKDSAALTYSGYDLSAEVNVKKAATLFARAGYAVNDNLLAYGLLGYTWAQGNASASASDSTGVVYSDSAKVDLDGVTVGLGAEYRFNANWSGYGEYAYTDFGKIDDTDGNLKASMQQIKLGVNYRF